MVTLPDSAGAFGANSSSLDVKRRGKVTFSILGRVFPDREVRVLRRLDVGRLTNLKFQVEHGFVLYIGRLMRASFERGGL